MIAEISINVVHIRSRGRITGMRKNKLKLFRAKGWFSFKRLVTCSNKSDIKGQWPDSYGEDEAFAPLQYDKLVASPRRDPSGQLQIDGNLSSKKKRWRYHVGRLRQSTGVLRSSKVRPKPKKPKLSGVEAASRDARIFEKPKAEVELRIAKSRAVAATRDACEQFRNFVI